MNFNDNFLGRYKNTDLLASGDNGGGYNYNFKPFNTGGSDDWGEDYRTGGGLGCVPCGPRGATQQFTAAQGKHPKRGRRKTRKRTIGKRRKSRRGRRRGRKSGLISSISGLSS